MYSRKKTTWHADPAFWYKVIPCYHRKHLTWHDHHLSNSRVDDTWRNEHKTKCEPRACAHLWLGWARDQVKLCLQNMEYIPIWPSSPSENEQALLNMSCTLSGPHLTTIYLTRGEARSSSLVACNAHALFRSITLPLLRPSGILMSSLILWVFPLLILWVFPLFTEPCFWFG